jgi:dTDP-4-amino-4,6-dideoxygalactose transaminase
LYSQLKQAKKITKKRLVIFKHYHRLLEILEIKNFIKRPLIPNFSKPNGHMYYIITKNNKRDKLIKYLKQKKISALFHYVPLHNSPFMRLKIKKKITMKNTNMVSNNLLRLPMHSKLNKKDMIRSVNEILNFFSR